MDINDIYSDNDDESNSVKIKSIKKELNSKKIEKQKNKLKKEAVEYAQSLSRRGVIYMSKVPPFMKPNKIRSLLEPYGEISRLYLQEESRRGSSKQFHEGWIEYTDKSIARNVADSLNNTKIGFKKGDYYHDDTWNLKYLKGFK